MFSLTYTSSALTPFSPRELRALLETCIENNRRRDVTGMLLYKDGDFMQVLEGVEATVVAVHDTIACDPRHRGLVTLLQGESPGKKDSLRIGRWDSRIWALTWIIRLGIASY